MTRNNRIKRVLIANRGEIALRIQRTCKKLKIPTVAVYSEADKSALHVREATQSVLLGAASAKESYLNMEKLIAAAKKTGCNALHPGYGFLSESSVFAQAVRDAGLLFIGPSSETIKRLGDKGEAKKLCKELGIPTPPGSPSGLSNEQLIVSSAQIGFPVMLKACAGGGGRGMRIIRTEKELQEALPLAREEVKKAFGSEDLYIEKLIERPRHVEVQIIGDRFGNVIHLGTRDCSTQRRHQKLIEEAPAPNLSPSLRKQIEQAAVTITKAAKYENAGTVEFLVSGENFYFLEVNTRLQVEHPVTEAVTGVDLVALQLKVAAGSPLPYRQSQIRCKGHAIEFRINAEDVENGFSPTRGVITTLVHAKDRALRTEFGYQSGDGVSVYYDGLIGKIIIKGASRSAVLEKSVDILSRYAILGIPTSLDLYPPLLENGVFCLGPVDIGFVERELPQILEKRVSAVRAISLAEMREQLLKDRQLWDPKHAYAQGSALLMEDGIGGERHIYEYKSKKFKTKYVIEVLHRKDGFFLATPVDAKGHRGIKNAQRVSNGLDTVMKSIIKDVLEKTPPKEIFSAAA